MYQQNAPKISTCDRHSSLHGFSEREAIDYETLVNPMRCSKPIEFFGCNLPCILDLTLQFDWRIDSFIDDASKTFYVKAARLYLYDFVLDDRLTKRSTSFLRVN